MKIKKLIISFPRIIKAVITNQIARFMPKSYLRITQQTGRGSNEGHPEEIAAYFGQCFDDYCKILGKEECDIGNTLRGKRVLEYGPGDLAGVALLFYAHGAEQVICVDHFPMMRLSAKNKAVIQCLINGLDEEVRNRAEAAIIRSNGEIEGFLPDAISYLIRPNGLAAMDEAFDIIISRSVLEHVNNLKESFNDMYFCLKPGAIAVHKVDLKSHGLHQDNQLDFLTWSPFLWRLMYSAKGVPNRWRIDTYRRLIVSTGFNCELITNTQEAEIEEIRQVRSLLPPLFESLSDADLLCLGFWMVIKKPEIKNPGQPDNLEMRMQNY